MANTRRPWIAGSILSVLLSLAVGVVTAKFAHWFDRLSPTSLFIVVFGVIAALCFAVEWFYRWEFGKDHISAPHLASLKATGVKVSECIRSFKQTKEIDSDDLSDLLSHTRNLKRAVNKWNRAISDCEQARWTYQTTKLAPAFADNGFIAPRFNRDVLLKKIEETTRAREENFQDGLGSKPAMRWVFYAVPSEPEDFPHDLLIKHGGNPDPWFIWGFDDPADPIDIEDCKRRFQSLFEEMDRCPELSDWVTKARALQRDTNTANKIKTLAHKLGRRDDLRRGRGCSQCN